MRSWGGAGSVGLCHRLQKRIYPQSARPCAASREKHYRRACLHAVVINRLLVTCGALRAALRVAACGPLFRAVSLLTGSPLCVCPCACSTILPLLPGAAAHARGDGAVETREGRHHTATHAGEAKSAAGERSIVYPSVSPPHSQSLLHSLALCPLHSLTLSPLPSPLLSLSPPHPLPPPSRALPPSGA